MHTLFTILRVVEAIACVAGLVSWRRWRGSCFRGMPVYLVFIVLSECVGAVLIANDMVGANKAFYSYIEIPVEFLFFFLLFHCAQRQQRGKWLPAVCAAGYLMCWLADLLYFSNQWFWFYSFSYTVGNLFLLILILRYFITLVASDAILKFKEDPLFWISTGLLLYYLGTFPYYGLRNIFGLYHQDLYITYSYIMYVLNCLMYLMFTLSFIWGKPSIKSSSS